MSLYKTALYKVREIADLKHMLKTSVELYADKPAFLTKKEGKYAPTTYKEYNEDVESFATALIDMGLLGKRIAVIGENRYEWAVAYMSVVCGVGVIVPLDKELPHEELMNLIEIAELEAIVYSPAAAKTVEQAEIKHKINMETDMPALIEKGKELINSGNTEFRDIKIDPHAMSILLFTSGTTSSSKAVMLSHNNIAKNLMSMCSMVELLDDLFLSVLPLHHTYECTCGFLCPIYMGQTIAYSEGLRHIAKNLKEVGATIMLGVPLLIESMYNKVWQQAKKTGRDKKLRLGIIISRALLALGIDIRRKVFSEIHENLGGRLRLLISGAAAIDPKVAKGLRDFGIEVRQGYGLTECAPIAALNRDVYFDDASAGLPLPGVELKIVNSGEGGIGEIAIKGENVMLGYYKNPEATGEVIRDGWFYSGDMGYIDDRGFLYITGRKKNVIVTKNGKNIYPEELETYLCRSPFISEALTYGRDDNKGDTLVVAQIVPDFEAVEQELGAGYTEEQLKTLIDGEVLKVNHKLQNYKRIGEVIIRREEFIKTTTRKIKRHMELKNTENN